MRSGKEKGPTSDEAVLFLPQVHFSFAFLPKNAHALKSVKSKE